MSSQLYKVLTNIEQGRKECINVLKTRNFPLNNNASLSTIAAQLEMLPYDEDYTNLSDISDFITYYDNPEDDPEVWSYPTEWPDCKSIFHNCEDIQYTDGYTYYPCWMGLLDNEHDTVRFTGYHNSALTETEQIIRPDVLTTNYTSKNAYRFLILTSDGSQYELNDSHYQTDGHVHTWDKSKDINNKYRYFIVYRVVSTAVSQISSSIGMFNTNILALFFGAYSYGGSNDTFSSCSTGLKKLQYIYKTNPFTDGGKTTMSYIYSCHFSFSGNNLPQLKCVEEIGTNTMGYLNFSSPTLVKLISTNTKATWGLKSFPEIIYADVACVTSSSCRRSSVGGSESYIPSQNSKIKYLKTNHEAMTNYYENNIISGVTCMPFLQNPENFTKYIQRIKTDTSNNYTDFFNSFINSKYLDLSNLKSVEGRYAVDQCSYAEIINLQSLESVSSSTSILFGAYNCKHLILDNLKSFSGTFNVPVKMLQLNLPSLSRMSGTFSGRGAGDFSSARLMQLKLPVLQEVSDAKIFYNLYFLKELELPQNFAYSLDLYNQHELSYNTILDIINKAADVSEMEGSYYLRFSPTSYAQLTEEIIAIATNKGWEVK